MGKKKKVGKERIDKYYKLAKSAGYRARSAFKLIQIARKYNIFKNANILIDLCAAPGGWLQVAYKNMNKNSTIIGVDLVPIRKIDNNVITIKSDITSAECIKKIKDIIKYEKADVILNDGAPNVGTTYSYDSFNQNILVLSSIKLAYKFLTKGGIFITKVFRNEEYVSLIWVLEKLFGEVKHIKPRSSREISSEIYLIGLNFLGNKIDKKYFDFTYIFSNQFRKDENKLSNIHSKNETEEDSENDISGNDTDNNTSKHKTKKKKGLNTILKEKKKKNRQGYEEGDDYRTADISDFINSDNYVDLLIKSNKFIFDKNYEKSLDLLIKNTYEAIYTNKSTNNEIFNLCKDLKVLGKSDLFNLIKWRYKIKKSVMKMLTSNEEKTKQLVNNDDENTNQTTFEISKEENPINAETINTKSTVCEDNLEELSNSSNEGSENESINEFSKYIEKKEKKEKKKKEKKLKKELEKKKINKPLKIDYDENDIHFNKDMLNLLNKQNFKDHLNILNNNKNNNNLHISEDDFSASDEENRENFEDQNNDNDELERLEYLVDLDYKQQKIKENKKKNENKDEKSTRRKRAMDYKNEELMKIQKIMELKNEELMMKKKLNEYLSDDEATESNASDSFDEDNMKGNDNVETDQDIQNNKYEDVLNQNKHIKKIVDKIIMIRKNLKEREPEDESQTGTSRFFDQKIFSNIFNQLNNDEEGEDENSENDIKEINAKSLPKIPLPAKLAKKEKNKKLREKYGNNETKIKNASFSIVKTDTNNSENVNEYFSNLIKDDDELAFIKYVGEKLIHKKSRMDLIDDSFNRHSYLEDENTLPDWFVEDEKKYRKPVIPIDKTVLDQYKNKINRITKMPIKKVIEAKMRNKKREITKMKKLEAKIGKIEKDEDDPFLKQRAIANVLKKNKSEKKREKSYVVCTGKGSKMAKKNKKGGKTMVKFVDKRLKKDKKAKKRIEKKKKNISRVKYSKSRPFKFKKNF
ncbi:methyltransferase, putative [Plasmodium berghei]|uniref:Putative rRNA methyltransferase n=2 Tax=Plasmodium berghei TaxID=5821 RepID=A0A509AMG5_PLABA|nr:large subunit rRNA methyltransferase, putative [Plasmodium berghei ANKA]CXI66582.1 methyltransferase, putative [Plasmodium berghei]SCM24048.1 methyltransferase, putative [Plasmodium berghei]SCN26900.1 methyltransferase, putative [Plasmodium berghei]SCO61318.1 methyltransferase, putative [Plasmodium berghei]SCO63321.1 methyltransferase, putative [Plasmodium berghei]|eukprot:XP_034422516.1 large subunit rRNA methyltransferase, putative [Plasmodium berghei ANKA]